ncbi:N-acetyltransferase [Chryseobacterium sp. A321]
MEEEIEFTVIVAQASHKIYVPEILQEIEVSALARGTGIAKRSASYVEQKIEENKAIMAFTSKGEWAGFCYIETWSDKTYVANSGLIVKRKFREKGLAKKIKLATFAYSREQFPQAKIFGLTTGRAVMKINSDLGYAPVTYDELTQDDVFWKGCESCVNYEILKSKERKNCLCTAMLYDPHAQKNKGRQDAGLTESKKAGLPLFAKFKNKKQWLWKK